MSDALILRPGSFAGFASRYATNPAVILLVSANVVNAGNLLFNLLFSRWVGPEAFAGLAFVLTVKLSILSVLNAAQMVIAERVSSAPAHGQALASLQISRKATWAMMATAIALPMLLAGLYLAYSTGGDDTVLDLAIVMLAAPFMIPLVLERGRAQGQINLRQIVTSAQVEMIVRLGGGALAWQAGFGIRGVVAAIALSLIAGWLAARPAREQRHSATNSKSMYAAGMPDDITKGLVLASIPWALLQAAQVIAMDGDIAFARHFLPEGDAGFLAAANILQRIQFFAVFVFAALLVPVVVQNRGSGRLIRALLPVASLYVAVNAVILAVMAVAPGLVVKVLFGDGFHGMETIVLPAGLSALGFSAVYLAATIFMALEKKKIAFVVLAMACVQCALSFTLASHGADLEMLANLKAGYNFLAGMAMLSALALAVRKHG